MIYIHRACVFVKKHPDFVWKHYKVMSESECWLTSGHLYLLLSMFSFLSLNLYSLPQYSDINLGGDLSGNLFPEVS